MSERAASAGAQPSALLAVLGALIAVFATAVPATASPPGELPQPFAISRYAATPPVPPSAFKVKASNGYSILVYGAPKRKGRPASIALFVTGRRSWVNYFAPAEVTETSIHANLGELGEIAVTFQPSGQERTMHPACGGESVSFDSGHYEGTIRFHGEEGYTQVDTTTAPGDLGFLLDLVCSGSTESRGAFLPGARLEVKGRQPSRSLRFGVVKNRPRARAGFTASITEKRDGIWIQRLTSASGSAHTFKYDPDLQTATVRPPVPFSGTAEFHRAAKSANRWSGNLTVDLPGKTGVRLTGRSMRPSIFHAHWEAIDE